MPGPCPGSGLAPCTTTPTVTHPRRYPMLYRASTSVTATRSPRTRSPAAGSPEAAGSPAPRPALAEESAVRARRPAGPDPHPVANAGVAGQRVPALRVRVHEARARRGVVGGQPEDRVAELQAQHDPAVPDRNVRAAVTIDPVR